MQRNLYINYQKKTRENQNQATPWFWAGSLQDCDTEAFQSDTEAVSTQGPVQLERSFALQPQPVYDQEEAAGVRGHSVLPEGSDKALRCGQVGSVVPGLGLPPALQDTGGCPERTLATHLTCPHQLLRLCLSAPAVG